ncbi:polysaccharide biosynthesis tyrosine autokinase [Microbacterium sp. M]|uniref:polysaccharide biosynthesis tyrosine autokinase n=1 Tax=Microbacterium sp. M TaxID=3377125 RepID=UPI0038670887
MTLHDYLTALRKHWIVVVLLAAIGAAAGFGYSQFLPDQYRAQASVIVIPVRGDNTSELVQGSNYVQNLVQTYTVLATSPAVLDPVIEELEIAETPTRLANRVDVSAPLNTVVIEIGVTDATPDGAQSTADAIAAELAVAVGEFSPTGSDDRPAVRIETIAPAQLPRNPVAPNTRMNTIIGGAVGLACGVVTALLLRRFGSRLTSRTDIAEATEQPLLGEVLEAPGGRELASTILARPDSRVAESLRQLAASLKFLEVDDQRRVILMTSAASSEGKSSVSLALALTLAEVGHRVLYLEADLRRPTAARYTQLEGSVGLTTVLIGDSTLEDAVQEWGHPNLRVLTSGVLPPNPGELVASGQLHAIIRQAREDYEYVIVDTAPVLSVSDALWLAPEVDSVLFVVRAGATKRESLQSALTALGSTHQSHLGIVLNGVRKSDKSPYYAQDEQRTRRAARDRIAR